MAQMSELREIDAALRQEYTVRRRMLIERAKVTLQSFLWAEKVQASPELLRPAQAAAQQGEVLMHPQPAVSLNDVFEAKQGAAWLSALCCLNLCVAFPRPGILKLELASQTPRLRSFDSMQTNALSDPVKSDPAYQNLTAWHNQLCCMQQSACTYTHCLQHSLSTMLGAHKQVLAATASP